MEPHNETEPPVRPDGSPERRARPTYPTTADAVTAVLDAAQELVHETRDVKELCTDVLRELAAVRGGQIAPAGHQIVRVVSHGLLLLAMIALWWRIEGVATTVPDTREGARAEIAAVVSRMTADLIEQDRRATIARERNTASIAALEARVTGLDQRIARVEGRIEGMPRQQPREPGPEKSSLLPTLGPPSDMRRVTDVAR